MIKFVATRKDGGGKLVGLGIEEGNVERLREGKPIHLDLRDMGIEQPIEILIFYGKTFKDLEALVRPHVGPDTNIKSFVGN